MLASYKSQVLNLAAFIPIHFTNREILASKSEPILCALLHQILPGLMTRNLKVYRCWTIWGLQYTQPFYWSGPNFACNSEPIYAELQFYWHNAVAPAARTITNLITFWTLGAPVPTPSQLMARVAALNWPHDVHFNANFHPDRLIVSPLMSEKTSNSNFSSPAGDVQSPSFTTVIEVVRTIFATFWLFPDLTYSFAARALKIWGMHLNVKRPHNFETPWANQRKFKALIGQRTVHHP